MAMVPPFRVDQIDHVEVFVPDRHAAAAWYRRVLGLEVLEDYAPWAADERGPLMISSDGGATKLALFTGTPQGAREGPGYRRVAFRVGGPAFLEFLARLPALEVVRPGEAMAAVDHERAFSIYFSDPYGNRLEVTTYDHAHVRERLR
jgi:catechol 2,3-dioxygenase-like lactoylglutathione lyase family enzyme